MLPKIFVDTSFVIALVNSRDTHYLKATDLSVEFEGYPLLISDGVLFEVGNALARSFKEQAIVIIDKFIHSSEVEIVMTTQSLFDEAYQLYCSYQDKSWGLVDCVSFTIMKQWGIRSAFTADHHFIQAGFDALMSY